MRCLSLLTMHVWEGVDVSAVHLERELIALLVEEQTQF